MTTIQSAAEEFDGNLITEKATFSMACFWYPDAVFGSTPGVIRTKVGYSGGTKEAPTYRNLGDHTETVQIEFDPNETSFRKLLEIFWKENDPVPKLKRQYMSIIFYHDETQEKLAHRAKNEYESNMKTKVSTEILKAGKFYDAEDYHQKYHLRQHPWLLNSIGISPDKIMDSHLCARLNGFIAGCGSLTFLDKEASKLKLTDEQVAYVKKVAEENAPSTCEH